MDTQNILLIQSVEWVSIEKDLTQKMNFHRPNFNRGSEIPLFIDIFTFILVERYDLQWIFECYVIDSCLARRDGEIRIRDLKVSAKNEVLAFDAWKADKQKQWNQDMATKEEAYQQKISSLESQLRTERDKIVQTGAEQQREKDKGFILAMSMKEKDLEEKTKEIARLRKVVRESQNGILFVERKLVFDVFLNKKDSILNLYQYVKLLSKTTTPWKSIIQLKNLNNTRIPLKIDDILLSVLLFAFLWIFHFFCCVTRILSWLFLDFSPE